MRVTRATTRHWLRWLPQMLSHLSQGRQTLVADQIASLIRAAADGDWQSRTLETWVASPDGSPEPVAAIVTIRDADEATVLVCGRCHDAVDGESLNRAIGHLIANLNRRWRSDAVSIAWWSDDVPAKRWGDIAAKRLGDIAAMRTDDASAAIRTVDVRDAPESGFERIADLRYRILESTATLIEHGDQTFENAVAAASLPGETGLIPVDRFYAAPNHAAASNDAAAAKRRAIPPHSKITPPFRWSPQFESLVRQTYVDSLDCPAINRIRTVEQTLHGYQRGAATDPSLWLVAVDADDRPVGLTILAVHANEDAADENCTGDDEAGNAAGRSTGEIVYLGIIPSRRRRGLGKQILRSALHILHRRGCQRVLVALDQKNRAADRLYVQFGFKELMNERLWAWHPGDPSPVSTDPR